MEAFIQALQNKKEMHIAENFGNSKACLPPTETGKMSLATFSLLIDLKCYQIYQVFIIIYKNHQHRRIAIAWQARHAIFIV